MKPRFNTYKMQVFRHMFFTTMLNIGLFSFFSGYLFVDKFTISGGVFGVIFVAILFGALNAVIKPLLKLLTFPIHLLSLGLSAIILNGLLLWILEYTVNFMEVESVFLTIQNLTTYIFAGLILSIMNSSLHKAFK